MAKQVVFDSLSTWNVGRWPNTASADFMVTVKNDTITTSNLSNKASGYKWLFGVGNISIEPAPTHVYDSSGKLSISLVAFGCEGSDTLTKSITIETNKDTTNHNPTDTLIGISSQEKQIKKPQIAPNPVSTNFNLLTDKYPVMIRLIDLAGKVWRQETLEILFLLVLTIYLMDCSY